MMEKLMARAEEAAERARSARIDRLASRAENLFRGLHVEKTAEQLILSGAGLIKRWLGDPALRFIGSLR